MKKYLLSFVSLFMVTLFAAAQDSEPVEKLFADGKYYIQNVESGLYWGAGNSWGTQASLVSEYQYVTLTSKEDGTYTMESMVSNGGTNYYFGGEYMDGSPVALTFTKAGDYYTIAQGENYFGYDGSSTVLGKNLAADNPNALWKLLTEEDIQADIATRVAGLAQATIENPLDATFLIKDANFGRNRRDAATVWTIEAGNKNLAGGGDNGNGCAESYHSTFTLSQILENAPAGVYKLTAQGFYRQDGEDNENLPCFYANEETSVFPLRTGSENDMNAAGGSFAAGKYTADPIFFELAEGEALTVGAKLEVNPTLWCIWDNFELTYYGTEADVNELKFGDLIEQVATLREQAGELQSNENISTVTMRSLQMALQGSFEIEQTEEAYKTAIAALDAAVKQANADITNKAAIDGMYAELEATNVYTAEAYETYKALVDGYKTSFDAGELTETVVNPQALAGWHSANTIDDLLLSAWSIGDEQAKDYDKALYINTWSVEGDNDGTNFHVPFFEYWTGDGNSLGANTLTATVEGVEPGQYDVTAWVRVRAKNGYTAPAYGITLDVNGGEAVDVAAGEQVGTSQFYLAEFKAQGDVGEDGILKINFNVAEDNNISWLSFKNVEYAVTPYIALENYKVTTEVRKDGDINAVVDYDITLKGAYAEDFLETYFYGDVYEGENVVLKNVNIGPTTNEAGLIYGVLSGYDENGNTIGLDNEKEYTLKITKVEVLDYNLMDYDTFEVPAIFTEEGELASVTFTTPAAIVLNAPTFNIEEGTQAEPNMLPAGETLKITYTADNLEAYGIAAEDLKVKVTVLVAGDLPENIMTMGSETAHNVRGESFYIPLGETEFPVALKEGYVYQNVAVIAAQLVKPATEEGAAEEVIATYAGAPAMCHWIGLDSYYYTEVTQDMYHKWTGVDATAEIAEGQPYCLYEVGNSAGNVYGTSNVLASEYADLSDYTILKIVATEGTPRLLLNRPTDDSQDYINLPNNAEQAEKYIISTEDGEYIYDLAAIKADYGFVHLNAIKGANWQNVTITSIAVAPAKEISFDIAVERYNGQGYEAQKETIDFTEAQKFLGVDAITYDMVRIVNPDGTEISDYAPYDGWFNADGVAETWGSNTKICVKFFQLIEGATYDICDMNKADEVGATYNVKWALVANDKKVFYNIGVTFIETPAYKPEIVKTIDIAHVEKAETAYCEEEAAPTFDVAEVCTALGIDDISKAEAYIVNVTTGNFVKNTTDGWRDANGDAAPWGDAANGFCLKLNNPASGEFDYTGAHDANFQIGDTYVAQWGLVANEKAVVLKVTVTFAENPATAITSLSADNADIEAVYTIGGAQLQGLQKGMNIVKYADGSVKKVFVK